MNAECPRIADQLRRAFDGKAWHGSALRELLSDVKAAQAHAHPLAGAHSIWELVLHIAVWTRAAVGATQGQAMAKIVGTKEDWPVVSDSSPEAWNEAQHRLFEAKDQLAAAIEQFEDARLKETVPGRQYDFYYLFHGIVQHSLYHAGQIALLKKQMS
ncbi:MAG TPA: DinB family protein [Candidatus Angelobacter sp.]|nr:DinB family protein [Candidatus Angelobacter sp.]